MRSIIAVGIILGGVLAATLAAGDEKYGVSSLRPDVTTEAKPWTSLDLNNDAATFRFAIIADNSGGPRAGVFAEGIAKLNLLQPEFVMGTGDLIEGYEDTREQIEAQWDLFMADVKKLEVPFFFVPGNHDIGRPMWAEAYKTRFGTPYYSFVYKEVLFLCLDTNDGPENSTGISTAQVEYATRVLREHANVRWTLVFQHKPLWNDEGAQSWKEIAEALKGRNCTVFAGHTHNYMSLEKEGISFITLATAGGGSPLRGPAYGELDAIAWVTMTDKGPRIANLTMDGILDRDFRTPQTARQAALFSMGRAVTATPVLLTGSQLETAVSQVTITNPSDKPLRIKVLTETTPGVRVEPGTIAAVIPGQSKHEAELRITADQPIPAAEAQPVVLHWTANYDSGQNTPSLDFAGAHPIPIDFPLTVPARKEAPVIDGKLDDWTELPFKVNQPVEVYTNYNAWKGPQDGAFEFGVSCDDRYLYIGVRTSDNELCFEGWKYWEDFAIVFVDGRASDTDDPKASVFNVMTGPGMTPEQAKEYLVGEAPEGTLSASARTDKGFEAEIAVPLACLNQWQGGNWQRVRLNVAFSDFDAGDAREGATILYWRPQWTARRGPPQSGLFSRMGSQSQEPAQP